MDKKKKEDPGEGPEQLWIYDGERRPVVVRAKNTRHADFKVRESPLYDGFPVHVYPIEEYIKMCTGAKVKTTPPPEPETKVYIVVGLTRRSGGKVDTSSVVESAEDAKKQVKFMTEVLSYKTAAAIEVSPKTSIILHSACSAEEASARKNTGGILEGIRPLPPVVELPPQALVVEPEEDINQPQEPDQNGYFDHNNEDDEGDGDHA